jgi:general secretion pathway protein G
MIELIFVIVIIGILAAVAIPKLAANRDDAEAATCVHEIGQLTQEISATYTKLGNNAFKTTTVSSMTNISTTGVPSKGLTADAIVHGATGVTYECDGTSIVKYSGADAVPDYNLTVTVTGGTTPASFKASSSAAENMGLTAPAAGSTVSKIYTL